MKEHWRLYLVLLIGFIGVIFIESLNDWMKVIWTILIIGGVMWAGVNYSPNTRITEKKK